MNTPAGHHGGGVDQRRDRRRAFHRVGQPGVQAELRRLAHRADEQQQAERGQDVDVAARGNGTSVPTLLGAAANTASKSDRAEDQEHAHDAEGEAEIADAVDDEGLDGGGVGADGWSYQKPISR